MTEYVILKLIEHETDETNYWHVLFSREARSAKAAISWFLSNVEGAERGTYTAVPTRSWQPVKVAVETALKFS